MFSDFFLGYYTVCYRETNFRKVHSIEAVCGTKQYVSVQSNGRNHESKYLFGEFNEKKTIFSMKKKAIGF